MERTRWLTIGLCLLGGCHGPVAWPPQSAGLTPEAEALAGAAAAPALEARYGGAMRDAAAEARMTRVGRMLVEGTGSLDGVYHFRLLKSNSVNALSLPGGRIYITCGLYSRLDGDAELAAVLAHEMAHLIAKDHFKPRCGEAAAALDREVCADLRAVCYLQAAGFSPDAMPAVIEIIREQQPSGWSDIRATSAAAKCAQFAQRPEAT